MNKLLFPFNLIRKWGSDFEIVCPVLSIKQLKNLRCISDIVAHTVVF